MDMPNQWSLTEAAAAVAAKTISSQDLVRACLDRIARRDDEVGAWTWLDPDRALAAAKARDGEAPRGPLHGVPIGIKDIIDTADMPTGYGSAIYAGHRPTVDAACVALIKRAGGIVMGKTVTTEFAYFAPGKTANPHNVKHTPGGSSSGSAAAVADFMVPAALGTQTAASVTRPASYCGVVGFKPTFGAYALSGIKPFAQSFDTLGTLTRNVEDALLMWTVLNGVSSAPRTAPRPPRIGMCRTPQWPHAQPSMADAVDMTARKLAEADAIVEEVALPSSFGDLADVHKALMAFESARSYAPEYDASREKLSPQLCQLIETGLAIPIADHLAARRRMVAAHAEIAPIFNDYDALLAPAAPGEAPSGLAATGDPIFSRMWTLLHLPSITLPVGRGPAGLPVGVQLIGAFARDTALFEVARWAAQRL